MTTSSDKAKSKLLESMRISKGSVSKTPTASKPAPEKQAAQKKTTQKQAASRKPVAKKAAKPARRSAVAQAKPAGISGYSSRSGLSGNDPFQAGARIWPD